MLFRQIRFWELSWAQRNQNSQGLRQCNISTNIKPSRPAAHCAERMTFLRIPIAETSISIESPSRRKT